MKKLFIENITNYPAVAYQETAPPENFTDYSNDIVMWDLYGSEVLQYIQIRSKLATIILSRIGMNFAGWNTLSDLEKQIAVKWIIAPYQLRLTIVSDEEDILNFKEFMERTVGFKKDDMDGRDRVAEEIRQYIVLNFLRTEKMSRDQLNDMYDTMAGVLDDYIFNALPSFKYWLNNAAGTIYETNGFAQKNYFSIEMQNGINNILSLNY